MPVKHDFADGEELLAHFKGGTHKMKRLLFQDGDASGDISHVVSALAVADDCMVLVLGPRGKSMADGYVDSFGISAERVFFLQEPGQNFAQTKGKLRVRTKLDLAESTNIVRTALDAAASDESRKALRKKLREAIRGKKFNRNPESDDARFEDFIEDKRITFDKDIVVLWGRSTGKERNQHTNLDSSSVGLYKLASRCVTANYAVIFAGDLDVCKGWQGKQGFTFFGRFWTTKEWTDNELKGRLEQVRLFYVLKKKLNAKGKGLVHVGMRSGGLDAYAFAQQHTIYIVPKQETDHRIAPLVDSMKNIRHPTATEGVFAQMQAAQPMKARYQDQNKTVDGAKGTFAQAQERFVGQKKAFATVVDKDEKKTIGQRVDALKVSEADYPLLKDRGLSDADEKSVLDRIQQAFDAQRKRMEAKATQ